MKVDKSAENELEPLSNSDESKMFLDVPLGQKLDSGLEEFFENVLRQREYARKAAMEIDRDGNRPPEVRLGRISSSGRAEIEFTNAMSFPSKEEFVELNKSSKNKLLDLYVLNGDEGIRDTNLRDWNIFSVSSTWIEIDLIFD